MSRYHRAMAFPLELVLCFTALLILPASGCDGGPPPSIAPEQPVDVDTERFSNVRFSFKDAPVEDGKFLLEKGKEYEYSGSFQLAEMDDEVPDYKGYVERIEFSLLMTFIVDGDKSGYGRVPSDAPVQNTKAVREVIVRTDPMRNAWFESPNIIRFKGKLKPPKYVGESEMRITVNVPIDPPKHPATCIFTRTVEVISPKTKEK